MKNLLLIALLLPFLMGAQENQQAPMFMNVIMTPHPERIDAFEAGVAAHNKKYHTQGTQQVGMFWIASGKNSGKYVWSLGPTTWDAMDESNNYNEEHTKDWNNNVAANALPEMETTYWKNDPSHSNFTKNFELKNLSIFMLDIKRFKYQEFSAVLDKVYKVFKTKDSDQQWGVYFNELANTGEGDFVWVDFFDKSAWMGQEDKFPQWFEEVHGAGSFASFLKDFEATTNGEMQEIWIYREDLSSRDNAVQTPD
ncbi:hypothetical protein [Flagellimonas lutimaris]|uniref:hypothetical protein n=1 Tax=Flagellimonas lutimaris TaxID=475082 RepID=UPI003F5CC067